MSVAQLSPGFVSQHLFVANAADRNNVVVDVFDLADLTKPPNALATGASSEAPNDIAIGPTGNRYVGITLITARRCEFSTPRTAMSRSRRSHSQNSRSW